MANARYDQISQRSGNYVVISSASLRESITSCSAQPADDVCTITDALGSTKILVHDQVEHLNRAKSQPVPDLSRRPRLPANADTWEDDPNGGSIFRSAAPFRALPNPQIAPTRVMAVLIVDDVAMNRDIAGSILRAAGYEVTCVAGGAEAIAVIKITEFDVVLMDVRMPAMDGLEATRHIRGLEGRCRLVPIMALTAQDVPEQIEACREAGMNGHVSKPFDPDELVTAVVRAINAEMVRGKSLAPNFMTVSAAAPAARGIGLAVPLIDPETFKRTASFLAPKALTAYLRKIATLTKALLVMLDGPEIPEYDSNEFAGAAHIVAGTAGMFGFERLTVVSRQFERATESGASDAFPLGKALSAAIKETLPEIRSRISAAVDA